MCTVRRVIATVGSFCAVTACAVEQPRGPTVMALPKQGTSLAVFQQQDQQCRNYAAATIGHVQPGQAGTHPATGNDHDPQTRYNIAYTRHVLARQHCADPATSRLWLL
jgi:hypothetical protein